MTVPSTTPLAVVTDALRLTPQLERAQRVLARTPGGARPSPWALAVHEAGLWLEQQPPAHAPPAAAREADEVLLGAARHDVRFRAPLDLVIPCTAASAARPERTLGPFRGLSGDFWVDLFGYEDTYSVQQAGASLPALVLTHARLPRIVFPGPHLSPYTIDVGAGTVWILASMLDPALPADRYAGFTVTHATLTLAVAPAVVDRVLTFTGPLDATLDATPASEPAAAAPGKCRAAVRVKPPDGVVVSWQAGTATLDLGKCSAEVGGKTIRFAEFEGTVAFHAELGAVVLGYRLSPGTLDAQVVSSDLVELRGRTHISGGWALTLTGAGAPAPQTEAAGPGFYALFLDASVEARWRGAPGSVELRQAVLSLRSGQLTLSSRHAAHAAGITQTLRLYALRPEPDSGRLALAMQFGPHEFAFAYVCDAEHGETLLATCRLDLLLDRPVDVRGRPIAFGRADVALFALETSPGGDVDVKLLGLSQRVTANAGLGRRVLALRNALLAVTEPALLLLDGTLQADNSVDRGRLSLTLGNDGWLPTLPDPYVTNLAAGGRRVFAVPAATGVAVASTRWDEPAHPMTSFDGALPAPLAVPRPVSGADEPRPAAQGQGQIRVPTQARQGSVPRGPADEKLVRAHAESGRDPARGGADEGQRAQLEQLGSMVGEVLPGRGQGLRLLDVSTNKDLLGVELVGGRRNDPRVARSQVAGGPVTGAFTLQDMDVCTPADHLRVFTLPQVQWEPVRTLDIDQDIPHLGYFPTPLASATDGGATRFGVWSAKLVPAIPDVAVDAVLDEFADGRRVGMLTTLPFGIVALLSLRPTDSAQGRRRDAIGRNQPEFADPALAGGAQLALTAESGPSGRERSSFFDGAALQLMNGVDLQTGLPLGISVLSDVLTVVDGPDRFFNNEFGPGGSAPGVPVTRFDVSGYGGSNFSEWLDGQAAYAGTAKVQFNVVVGRTALEVVKVATVLYPWAIRLTRTVTIERKGGGGVIRRDSGWQASSPGLFQFPDDAGGDPPYVVEPGLLRGLFDVRNIRPTGGAPVEFTSVSGKHVLLTPKYFDTDAKIDGVEGDALLPALGVLGFLQVEPSLERLKEEDVRLLIEQQGPIGGPIDGRVQIGGSGFHVRATRIEVGSATTPGGRTELVGVVRGAPEFHQDGAWSTLRLAGPGNPNADTDAVGVDQARGVPVVREGESDSSAASDAMQVGPQGDFRFADPEDLHEPDAPQFQYGFVQTSPAHAFLFPRPHVDPGVPELRSRTVPRFADVFARLTSKGVFPPAANTIDLPANALVVDPASGGFGLRDPVSLTAPRPPLILASNGDDVVQIDYGGASLDTSFDDSAWNLSFTGLELWSDVLGMKRFTGWSSELHAGTGQRPLVSNLSMLLAPAFRDAISFLRALDAPPAFPPLDLGVTNLKLELKLALVAKREIKIGKYVKLGLGAKSELGWERDFSAAVSTVSGTALATAEVEGKIPISAVFLLLGAEIEVGSKFQISPPPVSVVFVMNIKAYVGVAVEGGVFEGYIAVGVAIEIEGAEVKVGPLVLLHAEFDLKVVKAIADGEFKGLFYNDAGQKKCDWGGELDINVEIAWFGIHVTVGISETSTV